MRAASSAQYIGQVTGPLAGGFIAAHSDMPAVVAMTSMLMFAAPRSMRGCSQHRNRTREIGA
ncbi:hypothetical protein [Caballeronia glebae]|uniref:hypothetical protein n=1 Tax=Caballeronia glebae TaxID=1777143 RepID=UPI001F453CF6|nr:hypothetical protein [Caballeronia glebae]